MGRPVLLTVLVALTAVLGGYYQLSLKETIKILGHGRVLTPVGNTNCKAVPEAKACEKIVIHQPTGLVYMACSTQYSRTQWMPTVGRLNATARSGTDFVATYDPVSGKVRQLKTIGLPASSRGLSVHGMDVVPSKAHPGELLLYLVNHRAPLPPKDAVKDGQDSVVEVFRTRPGAKEIEHVRTFEHEVIATPNDILAGDDDLSFYFTNDHGFVKVGLARRLFLDMLFKLKWTNVGYCHHERGCKIAVSDLFGINGITKDNEGRIFVGSSKSGQIYVTEAQSDNSLVLTDIIKLDRLVDNLSTDESGAVWAAGVPRPMHLIDVHFSNPEIHAPSSALRISANDGKGKFHGDKFKVEKIFEDDGLVASGTTSVSYDVHRKKLYLHGIAAPHLTVCDMDVKA